MAMEAPVSSTSANLNQFLEETQLPLEMSARSASPGISAQSSFLRQGDSLHLASTPNINITVQDRPNNAGDSGMTARHSDVPNLSYKSRLQYIPSSSFVGETTSINAPSVPNTFKHKSHPNAKTKTHIMLSSVDEKLSSALDANPDKAALGPAAAQDLSSHSDHVEVKDWLPSYLNESWKEQTVVSHDTEGKNQLGSLAFIGTGADTLVHKKSHEKPIPIPEWKKAQQESEKERQVKPLEHIFLSNNDKSSVGNDHHDKYTDPSSMSDSSSEFFKTTPTQVSDKELHVIENFLEENKDMPDNHLIQAASPLKLYGKKYDTFTKAFLNGIVQDVRLSGRKVKQVERSSRGNEQATKEVVDRSTQNYLANADKVYENIRKIGSGYGLNPPKPAGDGAINETAILSEKDESAAFTPIAPRGSQFKSNETMGETFDYTSESVSASSDEDIHNNTDREEGHDGLDSLSLDLDRQTYTVAESFSADSLSASQGLSDSTFRPEGTVDQIERNDRPDEDTLDESSYTPASPALEANVPDRFEPMTSDSPITPNWKSVGDLKIGLGNYDRSSPFSGAALKGTVKPGNFPEQYGHMKMDKKNNRWDYDDKENLTSRVLESLKITKPTETQTTGILKPSDNKIRKAKRGQEVSFVQSPTSSDNNTVDVTQVLALQDMSFSQSDKQIVALITDATSETDWLMIKQIDLSNRNIDQLSGLDSHLPSLRGIVLSDNHICHLEGLPESLFDIDVSRNQLKELVSFQKFTSLQELSAKSNYLGDLSCLSQNVNLTRLDLEGNRIESLRGLESLRNLVTLKLKLNALRGVIDFTSWDLPKLQELDLSNNHITSVVGLEKLKQLRILNLSENSLVELSCAEALPRMKKLILSLNHLEVINLKQYPNLRVLRIDGNALEDIYGLEKLQKLTEVSAKYQKSDEAVNYIRQSVSDIVKLDLSGNGQFFKNSLYQTQIVQFLNVNELSLKALNLESLPENFAYLFPNVRILRLDFNNLSNLLGLYELSHLRELYLLSNNISKIKPLLASLEGVRDTLKVLDMKVNPVTIDFYPEFFKSYKLKRAVKALRDIFAPEAESFLQVDDYESFMDVSRIVNENKSDWEERDREYTNTVFSANMLDQFNKRLDYESVLIQYFPFLEELDGLPVTKEKCRAAKRHARATSKLLGLE